MKKRLSYREKLIELANIYNVKEVQEYIKRRKNLTSGQLELILKKHKIIIPKDFNTSFFKENVTKPISNASKQIEEYKENTSKKIGRFKRKTIYLRYAFVRGISYSIYKSWKLIGKAGLGFLNVFPKLGKAVFDFTGNIFTEIFNNIYDQKISYYKASKAIIGFFIISGVIVAIISGINVYKDFEKNNDKKIIIKKEIDKKIEKAETKKPDVKKKDIKKPETKKKVEKPKLDRKKNEAEIILPDLNLKTETVLNLFKDVNYDLKKVRFEKKVKPIYFTQFPKDLDEIQSVQLKKETFIKIVLPLIVAENEKILEDRSKLNKIVSKRNTSDPEKQWLRQKFLEYKVKKGSVIELKNRMDIIPTSIALAQAAKESGWGTSRFALEGNAIFGQWTWNGKGIEPLMRDKTKNHKILKFPILRASVKAYQNNLNTHKSYIDFRNKRAKLREKNKGIIGLQLIDTLDNYAQTGSKYTKILEQIIKQNRLMDFELVRLTNSTVKKSVNL